MHFSVDKIITWTVGSGLYGVQFSTGGSAEGC